ncbi:hypothetical protein Tco_1297565 [Tanacetum coccineum]
MTFYKTSLLRSFSVTCPLCLEVAPQCYYSAAVRFWGCDILLAPPDLPRRPSILVLPGQPIPVGQPYCTQPNEVRKMLTARKSVGPLPSHRLALRYSESHSPSDHFSPDNFASDTSPGSSSGYLSDTSSGRSIPDSSFGTPAASIEGASRKRCRSHTVSVPLATPVPEVLSPVRADLLPPCKRTKGSIPAFDRDGSAESSYETYTEPDIDSDVHADIDDDTEAAATREADIRVKDTPAPTDDEGSREVVQIGLDEIVQELYDHVLEIPRTSMCERIRILGRDNMRLREMLCIKREQIDSLRRHMAYTQEELRQICRFRYNDRMEENRDEREDNNGYDNGNGNGDGGGTGNRNGRGGGNGNGNPNVNIGGTVHVAREYTYQDFVKCWPFNFKGIEGVIGLTRWFEKMEMVFHISNCPQKYQVKYASCTLQNGALTWWNSHKRTVGTDAAYAMTWKALMKLMTEVYCPRNEI